MQKFAPDNDFPMFCLFQATDHKVKQQLKQEYKQSHVLLGKKNVINKHWHRASAYNTVNYEFSIAQLWNHLCSSFLVHLNPSWLPLLQRLFPLSSSSLHLSQFSLSLLLPSSWCLLQWVIWHIVFSPHCSWHQVYTASNKKSKKI